MANPYPQTDDPEDVKSTDSKPWLDMLTQAEKTFRDYQDRGDKIDLMFADANRLAGTNRDREYQLFWANVQVLAPSIYARPPVPVVVPRFRDRRPVPRMASELLERATSVVFDMEQIDQVMRLVRDDLSIQARGVPRVRLETEGGKRICIDHVHRRDFLMDPARSWKECGWVAFRAWLTKEEMKDRFGNEVADEAGYSIDRNAKDIGASDGIEKTPVWEIWHKAEKKVVWVTEGVDRLLDDSEPLLDLEGFFPCPRPAYGTLQRGSLVPIQDFTFYKDQLEEINQLTARIAALTDAVKVRGFYAGGSSNADALETAISLTDDRKILVPVPDWNAFGEGGRDPIIWMPLDMIGQTIAQMVELRKQLIADVYEITGLSDIMRGATDPNETLGAQQLKSQYGSVRVRDRQSELIRVAKDLAVMVAELLAEEFNKDDLLDMAQMEMRTDAEVSKQRRELEKQRRGIEQQVQRAMRDPQFQQMAQQDPEKAQQLQQEVQGQLEGIAAQLAELEEVPTIEKVMDLFRDQKLRPFVLDIETDSTIQPDEDAEKQRRGEFLQVMSNTLAQLAPLVQQQPQAATFAGEVLKFALAPYRAGRELEGAVDEFVDQIRQKAGQPQPNPEAEAAQAQAQIEQQRLAMDQQKAQQEALARQQEGELKAQEAAAKTQAINAQAQADIEIKRLDAEARGRESSAKLQQIAAQSEADQRRHAQEMEKGSLELEKLNIGIEQARVSLVAKASAPTAQEGAA